MTLFTKQKQTHRHKQIQGRWERNKLGVWDQKIQITVNKIDKQGPTIQHRELYSESYNKP